MGGWKNFCHNAFVVLIPVFIVNAKGRGAKLKK